MPGVELRHPLSLWVERSQGQLFTEPQLTLLS